MFLAAWVKMKLASQSQESGPDWDEEIQHRIQGIKAELLPKTRKSAQAKVQTSPGWGDAAPEAVWGFLWFSQAVWGGLAVGVTLRGRCEGQRCGGRVGVAVRKGPKLPVLDWLEEFFPQNILKYWETPPPVAGAGCPWSALGQWEGIGHFPPGAGCGRLKGRREGIVPVPGQREGAAPGFLQVRMPGEIWEW